MTVIERERHTAPRSALRYRLIPSGQQEPGQSVARARKSRPDTRTTTAPTPPDDLHLEEGHLPSRHRVAPVRPVRTKQRFHPLFFLGIGTLVTLILWGGVTQFLTWWANEYNTIVYGSTRTFQIDAVVGQGDSPQHPSHFVVINLHGVVTILDFPAGDASHVRQLGAFSVPGPNADQAVATLRFIDVNHNGLQAMLISIDGMQSVLVNDGKTFRQPTPTEQQQMLQELQQIQS